MTGTWHQLYNAGITKIRWPGWRDYLPYAKRRQGESVEEDGAQ